MKTLIKIGKYTIWVSSFSEWGLTKSFLVSWHFGLGRLRLTKKE